MSDVVTTHESWQPKGSVEGAACWHCDRGTYLVYETDETKTPRCGQCGELEQDDPAKSKPATVRRSNAKAKDKG